MYTPTPFAEADLARLADIVRANSFGLLVTNGEPAPTVSHLPFLLDFDVGTGQGRLLCHVARANPHWCGIATAGVALAVFSGPHGYVSPRWYRTAPAVPTWNYVAVHVEGRARAIHDPAALRAIVARLAERHEAGAPDAWSIESLPSDFFDRQQKAIVGIEIAVERISGKRKLSQNRPAADRAGVVAALESDGDPLARDLAAEMRARELE